MTRWFSLAGAITTIMIAMMFGVRSLQPPNAMGAGPTGVAVPISGNFDRDSRVVIYGDAIPTATKYTCTVTGDQSIYGFVGTYTDPKTGETWHALGKTGQDLEAGTTITCPANTVTRILLLDDFPERARVYAISLTAGSIFLGAWTALMFALTRTPRRR